MGRRREQGRLGWMGVAWVFAAVGPAIGGLVAVTSAVLLFDVPLSIYGFRDPGDALLTVFLSYVVGILPALITGLICGMVSPRVFGLTRWLALCAFVGASVSFVGFVILMSAIAPGAASGMDGVLIVVFALAGGLAGLGSGAVVRNRRPQAAASSPAAA